MVGRTIQNQDVADTTESQDLPADSLSNFSSLSIAFTLSAIKLQILRV